MAVFKTSFQEENTSFQAKLGPVVYSGGGMNYEIGPGLKVEGNVLSVDTATEVERDNTLPVTSGAVYVVVGNVEALLANI